MFEHLFKNKDGTDKRPFTIVHEDEFQRIVEQNAREEENWEPKEPEEGWEVTEHPSVAEEARIAAEDAQAALEGRKLEFGNNPCGNLRVGLLDGVTMPVPHRSMGPARPRRRREMT